MANNGKGISPASIVNYLIAVFIVIGVLLTINGRWFLGILVALVAVITYVNESLKEYCTDIVTRFLSRL